MDLDQDGHKDLVSGSWPGEIYWFRCVGSLQFEKPEVLKYENGDPIRVGMASATFVTDWHSDGDWDLVVGTVDGRVELVENLSESNTLQFRSARSLDLSGPERKENADAAPIVADWDADGRNDLLVGSQDGSVFWYRNLGTPREPRFAAGCGIVAKSPVGWAGDGARQEGEWGLRSKLCATDWNQDGKLDLLLGDMCGGFRGKPSQRASDRRRELDAVGRLPELQRHWAESFRTYRALPAEKKGQAQGLLDEIRSLKQQIATAQSTVAKYRPQRQSHGFVWLFLRR